MKFLTCVVLMTVAMMSCQKHKSSDDGQPTPNNVENQEAKPQENPATEPQKSETPSTPETQTTTPPKVVPSKYEAYVLANYADASAEDQARLVEELKSDDAAQPSENLDVFKASLDSLLAGRIFIRQAISEDYPGLDAAGQSALLNEFEAWMVDHVPASAIGASPYTIENYDEFVTARDQNS